MMIRSTRNIRRYDRMVDSLLGQSGYLKSLLGEARLLEEQEERD